MKHRLLRILSIGSLVAMLLFTMAGIALAVDYYLYVKVSSEQGTSDYAPLALAVDLNNQSLADLGYISDSGLDTRVTYAGSELKHMVATGKLAFVAPEVKGGVDYSYNYTMGNDPLTGFYIIPGYDGYVTVNDTAVLEPGNNFEIELKGHLDTTSGSDKNLVFKQEGFKIYVSGSSEITASILGSQTDYFYPDPHVEITSVDGYVGDISNTLSWAALRAEPGSYSDDDSDTAALMKITSSPTTDKWTEIRKGGFLLDTSALPTGAQISNSTFALYGTTQSNTFSYDWNLNLYSFIPASDIELVNGDYLHSLWGATAYSDTPVTVNDWDDAGWNTWTLNSTGAAAIQCDGITKFGIMVDQDATGATPSWENNKSVNLECRYAEAAATTYDPTLSVTYEVADASVTATGVSSGEHKVKVIADGTNLKIYIDDVEKDSVALSGASVPDNSNNWTLIQNNVAPYLDFYKHTVSSTLIVWYQPNDMISGITLPDREGTAQNGTITWGSLPTGVTTDVGSLKIVNLQNISKEKEEGAYLELFPEVPPEWEGMYSGEQYDVLPGSEAISELAAAGQIPIKLFWVPVIFGIAIFAGLYIYGRTKNIMAVAIAGGIVIGLFCAIGMLVWWVIIPYSIMAVALCVSEKTYGF